MEIWTYDIIKLYDILKRIDSLDYTIRDENRILIGNPDATIHIDITCFDKCWEVYLNEKPVYKSLYNKDRITYAIDAIREVAKTNKIFYQYPSH